MKIIQAVPTTFKMWLVNTSNGNGPKWLRGTPELTVEGEDMAPAIITAIERSAR